MRGIAKWHVFISNEAFLVAKGPQKRTWATWGKTTKYPHDAGKISEFFKSRVFHEI